MVELDKKNKDFRAAITSKSVAVWHAANQFLQNAAGKGRDQAKG
jgi:hypothetical protein